MLEDDHLNLLDAQFMSFRAASHAGIWIDCDRYEVACRIREETWVGGVEQKTSDGEERRRAPRHDEER